MRILKNRGFAALVLVAAIVLSSLYGLSKKPAVELPQGAPPLNESLSTAGFEWLIVDEAGILSSKTEKSVSLYNANWDKTAGSVMAVAAVPDAEDYGVDIEDAAWNCGEMLELGTNDALLLIDAGRKDAYLISNGSFAGRFNGQEGQYVRSCLSDSAVSGKWDEGVLALFAETHLLFDMRGQSGGGSLLVSLLPAIVLLIVLLVLFSWVDSLRYSSWYGRYGAMPVPPVVYRPIFWWHRPGGRWYQRRHAPPPPPRPAGTPEVLAPGPPWAVDRVLLWVVVTVRPGPRRPVREAAALAGEAVSAEVLPEAEASAAAEALEAVPEAGAVSEAAPEAEASEEAREAEAASGAVPEAAASEAAHAAEAASGAVPEEVASAVAGDKAKNIPGGRPVRRGFAVDTVEKKQTASAMSAGHGQR